MKIQKEWDWEEKDRKAQWKQYSNVVVLDKLAVEEALELVVERVIGKKMAGKVVTEAVERIHNKQIQVSSFGLLWISLEINSVV